MHELQSRLLVVAASSGGTLAPMTSMSTKRICATFLATAVAATCASCAGAARRGSGSTRSVPEQYVECSDAAPCAAGFEYVFGLCLERCGDGPACVEGAVCQDD